MHFKVELEFRVSVFVEGGKLENPEKNLWSKDGNQQQTQPTYDARSGNRTRATLEGALTTVPPLLPENSGSKLTNQKQGRFLRGPHCLQL